MESSFILFEKDFNKLKRKILEIKKNNKEVNIIYSGEDDDFNRLVLEKAEINFLMINLLKRRDFSNQRNSGFNQVFAKIAKKRNISIGINFDEIIRSNEKDKILSRIMQNIKLCNKNKIKMKFFYSKDNLRDSYDFKALGFALGMPTWMTKEL